MTHSTEFTLSEVEGLRVILCFDKLSMVRSMVSKVEPSELKGVEG